MSIVLITGSGGLIGAESARYYGDRGHLVVGIDNDMRAAFFGGEASTAWQVSELRARLGDLYRHEDMDIRDRDRVEQLVAELNTDLWLVVHTAAQPSHDWAAGDPHTDFSVNATGTLVLLEAVRQHAPQAVFVNCSTNKVYGDTPNRLPLVELEQRYEVERTHPYYEHGIDESMSVDATTHSLFGASKLSGDILCQEYGRYFGLQTGSFRGGCLTGPGHSGAPLHGFLAYLMKCTMTGEPYTVLGYQGKQVRDNIHSADLVAGFDAFANNPRPGEVYNMGGGRDVNCSMLEAIEVCERVADRKLSWSYSEANRLGDHMWWISDTRKFREHYPEWSLKYDLDGIVTDIASAGSSRWA